MKNYLIALSILLSLKVESAFCISPPSGDSLMNKLQQADHFKRFLDLPPSSLNFALSDINDSTAQTFIQFGLAQIYYHPYRAKLYAQKLQAFLHTHPLVIENPCDFYSPYKYGTSWHPKASGLSLTQPLPNEIPRNGLNHLVDLLPGVSFFSTLWGIFSLCCTLFVVLLATLYILARKNGTTFTLILNHNGQTTYL